MLKCREKTKHNVEDRRGRSVKGAAIERSRRRNISVIMLILILWRVIYRNTDSTQLTARRLLLLIRTQQEDELAQFVSVVLAETEDVWQRFLAQMICLQLSRTCLYTDYVESACECGIGNRPFIARLIKSNIDLSFYKELQQSLAHLGLCDGLCMHMKWVTISEPSG